MKEWRRNNWHLKFIYAGFIRTVRRKKNIIKKVIAVIDTTFTIAKKSLGKIHVSTGFDNTGGGGSWLKYFDYRHYSHWCPHYYHFHHFKLNSIVSNSLREPLSLQGISTVYFWPIRDRYFYSIVSFHIQCKLRNNVLLFLLTVIFSTLQPNMSNMSPSALPATGGHWSIDQTMLYEYTMQLCVKYFYSLR